MDHGERTLIVDDILTTGLSIRETLRALENYHPDIIGIEVLVDRSDGVVPKQFSIPCHALLTVSTKTYEVVAQRIQSWNKTKNCGLVVGGTCPEELRTIRSLCSDMVLLIPGIGTQGGDLEASVLAGIDNQGERAIIAVSRAILYANNSSSYAVTAGKRRESCVIALTKQEIENKLGQ